MQQADSVRTELTPEESWRTIHTTLAQSQNSLYPAGTAYILLLWGAITSVVVQRFCHCWRGWQCIDRSPRGLEQRGPRNGSQSRAQGVCILDDGGYRGVF